MVSVIIPNYNHNKYLLQRIESVLNQTFQDFELIILDDCSTDQSKEVIENYRSHEKVSHIVYNDQNSGSTFKQWQKGFALAKGEYIWIAESDDVAELDFLLEGLNVFKESKNIGLVATNFWFIDEFNNKYNGSGNYPCYNEDLKEPFKIINGREFTIKNMLKYNSLLNASGIVFKKEAINGINNDYKAFKLCGDWLFWNNILLNYDIGIIKNQLNLYRVHSGTVRKNEKIHNIIKEDYKVFSLIKSNYSIPNKFIEEVFEYKFNNYYHYIKNNNLFLDIYFKGCFINDYKVHYRVLIKYLPLFLIRIKTIFRKLYFLHIALKNKINKIVRRAFF